MKEEAALRILWILLGLAVIGAVMGFVGLATSSVAQMPMPPFRAGHGNPSAEDCSKADDVGKAYRDLSNGDLMVCVAR